MSKNVLIGIGVAYVAVAAVATVGGYLTFRKLVSDAKKRHDDLHKEHDAAADRIRKSAETFYTQQESVRQMNAKIAKKFKHF